METIDRIINFAEIIGWESNRQVQEYSDWVDFISPIFLKKFNFEYRDHYKDMYHKDIQRWISKKRLEFKKINLIINK